MSKVLLVGYDRYNNLRDLFKDFDGLSNRKIFEAYGIKCNYKWEENIFKIIYFKQEETSEYINIGTMLKETITIPERKYGILIDCPMSCFIATLIKSKFHLSSFYFKEVENTDNLEIMKDDGYHQENALVFPIMESSSIENNGNKNKEFIDFINNVIYEFCKTHKTPGNEMKTFYWYTNRNWKAKHISDDKQKIQITSGDYFYYVRYDATLVSDEELKNVILEKLAGSKFADVPVVFTDNLDYWLAPVY